MSGDLDATLEAYRREKWAQLADDGEEGLRRELSGLEHFLEHGTEAAWVSDELVAFREAKAEVLRSILEDAHPEDAG